MKHPKIYKWAEMKSVATKVAAWAYARLLDPRKSDDDFPLTGASYTTLADGSVGINLPKRRKPRQPQPFTSAKEITTEYVSVKRSLKRSLAEAENLIPRVNQDGWATTLAWLSHDLGNSIFRASELLARLASSHHKGVAQAAVNQLASAAVKAAIELEQLSFREDIFPLVQTAARQMPFWAAVYSPLPKDQRELKKRMEKLGVGIRQPRKPKGARWNNDENIAGQFANQIGSVLCTIHFNECLQQTFWKKANGIQTQEQWESRLESFGWPRWIVRLHSLPKLTKESAPDWFEIGWDALQEAASNKVCSLPALKILGKTSAGYCDKHQIEERLRKAFISRFATDYVIFGTVGI